MYVIIFPPLHIRSMSPISTYYFSHTRAFRCQVDSLAFVLMFFYLMLLQVTPILIISHIIVHNGSYSENVLF